MIDLEVGSATRAVFWVGMAGPAICPLVWFVKSWFRTLGVVNKSRGRAFLVLEVLSINVVYGLLWCCAAA